MKIDIAGCKISLIFFYYFKRMWRFIRLISTKTNIKTPITLRYDKNQYKINKLTINIIPFNNIRFILLYVLRVFFKFYSFWWFFIHSLFLVPHNNMFFIPKTTVSPLLGLNGQLNERDRITDIGKSFFYCYQYGCGRCAE